MSDPIPTALLEVIRCPQTGQRLQMASEELVAILESQRRSRSLPLQAPVPQLDLSKSITAALLREDGLICYAIQEGVPLLLPDHGIAVPAKNERGDT